MSPPLMDDENLTEIDDEESCQGKRIKNLKDQSSPKKMKKGLAQ